jgi:phosphonate transport system permease protein
VPHRRSSAALRRVFEDVDPAPAGDPAGRRRETGGHPLLRRPPRQAWPQFLAYTLYRWEVTIRAAAVLGFVGAGGLGQRIHIAISLFLEHQLLTLILAIYLMVTLVDALSTFLRYRVV